MAAVYRPRRCLAIAGRRWHGVAMDILACLRLQLEFGADEALQPRPRDRRQAEPPSLAALSLARPAPPASPPVPSPIPMPAPLVAVPSLAELEAAQAVLPGCPLIATAGHMVFGAGPTGAPMFLADTPAEAEDMSGQPFGAEVGWLLDRMLESLGLTRATVRLAYAVPWRPPGSRAPTPSERDLCRPYLARHIALARPPAVVCLGVQPAAMLLPGTTPAELRRLRGSWQAIHLPDLDTPIPLLPSLSLEQVLKKPSEKALIWADLIQLAQHLAKNTS